MKHANVYVLFHLFPAEGKLPKNHFLVALYLKVSVLQCNYVFKY